MSKTEQPSRGKFPFQDVGAGKSNGFLAWVRDHSSYLTAGGIADQLASMGSYAWGTLKNFLCLSPVFLLASLVFGWFHFGILARPYCLITTVAAVVSALAIFVDCEKCLLSRKDAWRANKARVARCGGWLILGSLVGIVSMTVPLTVELLREHAHGVDWTWTKTLSSLVGGFGALVAAQRTVPMSAGNQKKIAAIIFGLIGIGFLFATLVALTYFFVYGNVLGPLPAITYSLSRAPESTILFGTLAALTLFAAIKLLRAWAGLGWSSLVVFPLFCVAPFLLFFAISSDDGYGPRINRVTTDIGKLSRPLALVVDKPFDTEQLNPRHAMRIANLKSQLQGLNDFIETQPPEQSETDARNAYEPSKSEPDGKDKPMTAAQEDDSVVQSSSRDAEPYELTEFAKTYLSMAHHFVVDGYGLVDLNGLDKAKFRQTLAQMDRIGLVRLAQFRQEPSRSHIDDDALSESTQNACLASAVRLIVQNKAVVLKAEQTTTPKSLEDALAKTRIAQALEELKQYRVSALHQAEFAALTGSVVPMVGIPERKTSFAKGSITLVPASAEFDDFAVPIRQGLLARHLRLAATSLPEIGTAPAVEGLTKEAVQDAIDFERVRRSRKTGETSAMLDEIASYFESQMESGSTPDERTPNEARYLRRILIEVAINGDQNDREHSLKILANLSVPVVDTNESEAVQRKQYATRVASVFDTLELFEIAMLKFIPVGKGAPTLLPADQLVMNIAAGKEGDLDEMDNIRQDLAAQSAELKASLYLFLAGILGVFAFFTDVNSTSINGFYRDHLAQAFLLRDDNGTVKNDTEIQLTDLSPPGSLAPYLLINTAMNMQASGALSLRDRRSEFFVFSKLFSGCEQTGYIASAAMQAAYPPVTLATAMAISAAAAAPNMGRNTNGLLTMLMGLLNIRLGYWVPNPRLIQKETIKFEDVVRMELNTQVFPRRRAAYEPGSPRSVNLAETSKLLEADLVGLGFSGGGIRSASINLGIAQVLHREGLFRHVDYLSTVSGGGYLGSAIATLMRHLPDDAPTQTGEQVALTECAEKVITGLTAMQANEKPVSRHRLPVLNFGRELVSCLHDKSNWVNLSDGGHIENLAAIELLRRRCRIVIVGDGEADPHHSFNGLATLIRLAKLELETVIDIDVDQVRLFTPENEKDDKINVCKSHFSVGRILYPGEGDEKSRTGYLLYLKSSFTGSEEVLVREYRDRNPGFPHQTTADQFFDIGQFEAYRHLGLAIAGEAIDNLRQVVPDGANPGPTPDLGHYPDFEQALAAMIR